MKTEIFNVYRHKPDTHRKANYNVKSKNINSREDIYIGMVWYGI